MTQRKEPPGPRTFVKISKNGERLTRTVTSVPASEVEARFDGFRPEEEFPDHKPSTSPAATSTSGGGTKPATGSTSS